MRLTKTLTEVNRGIWYSVGIRKQKKDEKYAYHKVIVEVYVPPGSVGVPKLLCLYFCW